jgi:hypothetical protein
MEVTPMAVAERQIRQNAKHLLIVLAALGAKSGYAAGDGDQRLDTAELPADGAHAAAPPSAAEAVKEVLDLSVTDAARLGFPPHREVGRLPAQQ